MKNVLLLLLLFVSVLVALGTTPTAEPSELQFESELFSVTLVADGVAIPVVGITSIQLWNTFTFSSNFTGKQSSTQSFVASAYSRFEAG
jgi:hypothetical protein